MNNRQNTTIIDRYLAQQIKKWVLSTPPPADGKQHLMLKIADYSFPSKSHSPNIHFYKQIFHSFGYSGRYPDNYGELFFPHMQVPARLLMIIS